MVKFVNFLSLSTNFYIMHSNGEAGERNRCIYTFNLVRTMLLLLHRVSHVRHLPYYKKHISELAEMTCTVRCEKRKKEKKKLSILHFALHPDTVENKK